MQQTRVKLDRSAYLNVVHSVESLLKASVAHLVHQGM